MKAKLHPIWDWTAAALLVSALLTASVRLDTTNWTPDLGYVESLAVMGTILGLVLGYSLFRGASAFWLASLYTLSILPMSLSRIITNEQTAQGQLVSFWGRLSVSFGLLVSGKPITDSIFFVTVMAILFWLVGIYSGFQLVRSRAILPVLLPSTLPILVIQYYDGYVPEHIWGLGFYFFLALMLVGRINLLNSRERWEEQHILSGSEPEFDLNKNIAVAAAVIILAAWLVPAPNVILPGAASAWQSFNQPFDSARKLLRVDDILAALNSHNVVTTYNELYGDVMGLGRSAGTGETELFRVQAPPNDLPRLYWRMRVYDTYENGSWKMLRSQNTPFNPDTGNLSWKVPTIFLNRPDALAEPGANRSVSIELLAAPMADFTFSWRSGTSAILATPFEPVWTSRKGTIQTVLDQGGESDPLSWNSTPALQNGDQYLMRSLLPNPTQVELRAICSANRGCDYPTWISAHYMQVPANIAPAYSRLALEITSGLTNNYDKAEAITAYLRQNITYSQTLPNLPSGVEPLNWFLFDGKTGFCDYYASAEIMLLRTIGIPARMAVGFAQGKSEAYFTFSVRGMDAHAWPEAYFPGIGWVQFEPTVNQAALVRPSGEVSNPAEHPHGPYNKLNNLGDNNPKNSDANGLSKMTFLGLALQQWLWIIIYIIIIILVSFLGWRLERQQPFGQRIPRALVAIYHFYHLKNPTWVERWLRWSEAGAEVQAFHAINQSLNWLGSVQSGAVTPLERASKLKELLPEAEPEIDILSSALEKTLFTPHPADAASVASALQAGWRLRLFVIRKIARRWL